MRKDKQSIITCLMKSAMLFNQHLEGKHFLYLFDDNGEIKYHEVVFNDTSFLHLTGVETKKTAREFYYDCLHCRLGINDISIKNGGTTFQKISVLEYVFNLTCSSVLIGSYDNWGYYLKTDYLIGDTKKIAILGFKKYKGYGFPNTLLAGDIKEKTKNPCRVIAILKKDRMKPQYNEVTYQAKNVDLNKANLSDAIRRIISPDLFDGCENEV